MVRGSGAICHYLRQTLWKCEDAGSFGTIIIESPCTNNMANDTAIDDEHQEATCQEGTLSERPVVLQEVLADQMQMPLPTADRKFKFIEGDWFVRMPVSYSTSMHKKVWFFTARAGTITLAARDRVIWCTVCTIVALSVHVPVTRLPVHIQCVMVSCWIDLQPIRQAVCCSSTERSCNF